MRLRILGFHPWVTAAGEGGSRNGKGSESDQANMYKSDVADRHHG